MDYFFCSYFKCKLINLLEVLFNVHNSLSIEHDVNKEPYGLF